jgi:hypothetical protein
MELGMEIGMNGLDKIKMKMRKKEVVKEKTPWKES